MIKTSKFLISLIILLMLVMPVVSLAQAEGGWKGLVPCTNKPASDGKILDADRCDFNAFLNLINKVIRFILFNMVVPIAAIMFAYAGFLLITAGGEMASARTKAKSIFSNAVFGLIIAVAAWLIIRTILSILGYDGTWIFDRF